MRTVRSVVLRGKRWRWRWVSRHLHLDGVKVDGFVDWDRREIIVQSGLSPKDELETVIHEVNHCCWPDATEEAITEASRDLAALLWRLGYRRTKE